LLVGTAAGPVRADEEATVYDPWEKMNRGIFAFNEFADRYFIEYLAIGYDALLPDAVERGIDNVFENGRLPVKLANNLLQLKFMGATEEIIRFALNTSVGIGGLFDAAADAGLPSTEEDFGQTLGYWGVPPGPFLMLPVLGPSNIRDGVGLGVDSTSLAYSFFLPFWVNATLTLGNLITVRSLAIEVIRENRASAFDLYVFTRNAYMSNRSSRVRDENLSDAPAEIDEDLYYFDDEEDEEW
jgi:phospholipid-binding lipoprotein MlaA